MHTLRDQFDPSAFKTTFSARLMALSRAHDLLTRRSWQGVILGDVVAEAALPFDDKSEVHRVEVSGPDVLIEANAAVTLSMMMHELFTNAVKYGALSNVGGKVSLTWSYKSDGDAADRAMIDLMWTESCGPRINKPQRRGFGTRLIEASADQLGAKLLVDYAAEGLRCRIALPIQATDKLQESLQA
jgi:two-component sensor histidine kinase